MPATLSRFDVPPYRLSGAVYGALLNHRAQLAALGDAVHQPPYKAPPQAPVLSVMPRHMQAAGGTALVVPPGAPGLEVGPALGIVIGRVACRVPVDQALDFAAAYVLLGEVSLPLASHYRPAVRLRARDGFCPIGARVVPAAELPQPDALSVQVDIDGQPAQHGSTADRVRGVARLLADVTDFMTLQPGDVLSLGRSHGAPLARVGQTVTLRIDGLGELQHRLVAAGAEA
jgi:5-oxopent-3-ene-1,2,5-tricarboxylate decarboxylase/2-hydroxyhepta-2,4-diene-1,7-dioate isomerase